MIDLNISENVIHALSWTVIHSLWQVSVIALIMSGILTQLDTHNATSRYKVSLGALGAVLLSSLVTFMIYYNPALNANESFAISGSFMSTEIINSTSEASFLSQIIVYLNTNVHLISKLWIIGVVLFSIKFLIGYFYIQYLNYEPSLKINNTLTEKLSKLRRKWD